VKLDGIGAGGIFAKGLLGGNSDFGSDVAAVAGFILANGLEGFCSAVVAEEVVILMLAKGFDGFCSLEVVEPKEVTGVEVVVEILAKGFDPVDVVDPNENEGNVEDENVGAFIPPNNPPPFDAGTSLPMAPPFIPVYNQLFLYLQSNTFTSVLPAALAGANLFRLGLAILKLSLLSAKGGYFLVAMTSALATCTGSILSRSFS
jgi:hypothetical protein